MKRLLFSVITALVLLSCSDTKENLSPEAREACRVLFLRDIGGGQAEEIKYWLEMGVDVNTRDEEGRTALHLAATSEVMELLIAHGADVNATDNEGNTPLHEAANRGNASLIKLLLKSSADVSSTNKAGMTHLHSFIRRSSGVVNLGSDENDFSIVRLLTRKGVKFNAVDNEGNTALHHAAEVGDKEMVEFLIAQGLDMNAGNNEGYTPLDKALRAFSPYTALYLLKRGATCRKKPEDIPMAAMFGDIEKIRTLLATGADVNLKDRFGWTALFHSIENNNAEIAELLIASGADANARNFDKRTPLHWASLKGSEEVVQLLLAKSTKVNARDVDGKTPLYFANQPGVAVTLIAGGADINLPDNNGWTPLHRAAFVGNEQVARILVNERAAVNTKDKREGRAALHLAAENGYPAICAILIAADANVNLADKDGKTPLDYADADKVRELLRAHGAKSGKELQEEGK